MAEKEKLKRTMNIRRLIIIVVGAAVVLGVGITALVFVIVTPLLEPLVSTGDDFFTAIQEGELDTAYSMLSVVTQAETDEDVFDETFVEYYEMQSWSYNQRVNRNGFGRLEGQLVDVNGDTFDFRLLLQPRGDGWEITSYEIFETP